ncbi:hypothetical protein QBC43DRAFT_353848, partial [Cladorrhinum sp. PSN259]
EDLAAQHDLPLLEFWNGFLHDHVVPFRHREYVRAACITLALPENKDRGLLEIATDFAESVYDFKQRNSQFRLLREHSRTTTVFWLYQVKLALDTAWKTKAYENQADAPPFPVILSHAPHLLNEKLPLEYYTERLLNSDEAQRYWMLPTLKPIPEYVTMPKPIFAAAFGSKTTKADPEDFHLERYLRLALVVVQRYLRPGEARRRSWFVQLAFESIQKEIMQLRSLCSHSDIPLYSETKAYFCLQLVHAALSQLQATGEGEMIQNFTYHSFQQLFAIKPSSIWKKHYSAKVWDSVQSRGRFSPPDLKPLPTTIPTTNNVMETNSIRQVSSLPDPNEAFRKLGLIPELPSMDIINFNLAILLEDNKTIALPISPSSPDGIPTDAHLLRYIHSFVILGGSTDTIPLRAKTALSLLSRNPTLNLTRTTFLLNLCLSLAPGISLAYPTIPSLQPNTDYSSPSLNPTTIVNCSFDASGNRLIYHNCPCHSDLPMDIAKYQPYTDAVAYPDAYPHYHAPDDLPPQIYHGCECHSALLLDQDKLAVVVAEKWKTIEKSEKVPKGTCYVSDENSRKELDEDGRFIAWLRGNLVLVCGDEVGRVWYEEKWGGEEEGKKKWVKPGREKIGNWGFEVLVVPEEESEYVDVDGLTNGVRGLLDVDGEENDDAKTLADAGKEEQGEGEGEAAADDDDDDWEAVSQSGTLC